MEFLNAFGEEVSMSPLSLNGHKSVMQVSPDFSNLTNSEEKKSKRKQLLTLKSVDAIMKSKPRGKEKMQFNQYEQKCLKQIEQISRKMNAISSKKDKEWLRLRQ